MHVTSNGTEASRERVAVAILAAGHGTRMKSDIPKHLHTVGGTAVVERVIRAGMAISPDFTRVSRVSIGCGVTE